MRSVSVEDAAIQLAYARHVIVVPGYGMAVAQAQHQIRELAELIEARGGEVKYAIHPVAGRMPGHMNVLLAEANVAYDKLFEMDEINGEFGRADVALIIGANDVVNPAARNDRSSPIYGMPILNADQAKSIIVLKRSMNPGFAGIENELFLRSEVRDPIRRCQELVDEAGGGGEDFVSAAEQNRMHESPLKPTDCIRGVPLSAVNSSVRMTHGRRPWALAGRFFLEFCEPTPPAATPPSLRAFELQFLAAPGPHSRAHELASSQANRWSVHSSRLSISWWSAISATPIPPTGLTARVPRTAAASLPISAPPRSQRFAS